MFWDATIDTVEDRYLHQVRIVSRAALGYLFRANPEASALPDQPRAPRRPISRRSSPSRRTSGTTSYAFSRALSGTLGGDGDWAKELLGFGFAVENGYLGRLPAVEPALAVHQMMPSRT